MKQSGDAAGRGVVARTAGRRGPGPIRIGVIGLGFIGSELARRIVAAPELGLELAFVHDEDPAKLAEWPADRVLAALSDLDGPAVDLVVECASPTVVAAHGAAVLAVADFMILSVTALADDDLSAALSAAAEAAGTRLLVPHGALVGADGLRERAASWREVTITFRKHPDHIDGVPAEVLAGGRPVTLYDGPVREAARRYPHNVNAMVTCALASIGLDRCRGILVADPTLRELVAEVRAVGADGSVLEIVKRQPGVGVSGTEMPDTVLQSVLVATDRSPGIAIV